MIILYRLIAYSNDFQTLLNAQIISGASKNTSAQVTYNMNYIRISESQASIFVEGSPGVSNAQQNWGTTNINSPTMNYFFVAFVNFSTDLFIF